MVLGPAWSETHRHEVALKHLEAYRVLRDRFQDSLRVPELDAALAVEEVIAGGGIIQGYHKSAWRTASLLLNLCSSWNVGAGGVVATVGAVAVMLMAMCPVAAGAQAGDFVDEVQEDAVAEIQNASMMAEGVVQDADALKNDTTQTAVDTVLDAYGTAVEEWPESAGVFAGGEIPVPSPLDLEGMLSPPRSPTPPPEKEVRKTVEEVTASPTDTTSIPDSPHDSNTTGDNETLVEGSPTPPERGSIPYAEKGGSPEPAARPPAEENPPAPLGMVASEAGRMPVPGVVVFAAAGLALAGVVAWLLTQTRFLGRVAGGSAVALFSRQTGMEVLQSPVRARIHAIISEHPGITLKALAGVTGIRPSTLRYHLEVLRREELVSVARGGKTLHYHPAGADPRAKAAQCLFLKHRGLLAKTILGKPGASQQRLAQELGVPASFVCRHVRDLTHAGLVHSERAGRYLRYFPTELLEGIQAKDMIPET